MQEQVKVLQMCQHCNHVLSVLRVDEQNESHMSAYVALLIPLVETKSNIITFDCLVLYATLNFC